MLKRSLAPALIVSGCLIIDQLSKSWAQRLTSLHFNQGFILGIFAELPDSLRIVTFVALAGFIFFLYLFLMYLIPHSARWVKYGLSFSVGGIFGNVIDKIIYGRTMDFIPFQLGKFQVLFNLADVFQWMGCGIVVWMIFKRDKLIWFPQSSRQNYLINPREQFRVAFIYTAVAFSTSLIMGLFSFAFFRPLMVSANMNKEPLMLSYGMSYLILSLLFCALSFLTGIIISHRSSGPLYAFEQYLDKLIMGKNCKFVLRDSDHFQHLQTMANKLQRHFNSDENEESQ